MDTDIVKRDTQTVSQHLEFGHIEKMAEAVAKSGLFGIKTKEQALALMLIAQAEGRHPALAARDYNIIQGKPSKTAEAMLRDFLDCGGKVEWHGLSDTIADATFSHSQGGSVRITWDMERAGKAGLSGKDNWKKHPRQMLRSRVVSEGVRTVCPSATSGFYVPEEVQDFSEAKNVTPLKSVNETHVEYEPEYERSIKKVTQGNTDFVLMCDKKKESEYLPGDINESTGEIMESTSQYSELESFKSIAKQLIEKIQKLEPSRNLDETVAFLTGNDKATFAGIDLIKSKEKQAKLETLINTANMWCKAWDIKHTGMIGKGTNT